MYNFLFNAKNFKSDTNLIEFEYLLWIEDFIFRESNKKADSTEHVPG